MSYAIVSIKDDTKEVSSPYQIGNGLYSDPLICPNCTRQMRFVEFRIIAAKVRRTVWECRVCPFIKGSVETPAQSHFKACPFCSNGIVQNVMIPEPCPTCHGRRWIRM